jgi:hypothetical protein
LYWGYNRDHEKLPQINLAMLFGQKSNLPAYYRRMPGNISDVVTLKTTMDALGFLGQTKLQFVLDQGFYSEGNVDALFERGCRFVLMVPTSWVWVRRVMDLYYESIASPACYRQTGEDEVLYMVSHPYVWGEGGGGFECFVHLFYSVSRAALDFDGLTKKLVCCKEEFESGNRKEVYAEFYERFFIVGGDSKEGVGCGWFMMRWRLPCFVSVMQGFFVFWLMLGVVRRRCLRFIVVRRLWSVVLMIWRMVWICVVFGFFRLWLWMVDCLFRFWLWFC